MIIKNSNSNIKCVSQFDLLGEKETALCKAFAYILSHDKKNFQIVLKNLFQIRYASQYFENASIIIEKSYDKIGRTDLEIFFEDKNKKSTHIIFECKVGKNSVHKEQNEKYLKCFDKETDVKILCFVTQNVPSNRVIKDAIKNNIKVIYYSWIDILYIFENKNNNTVVNDFIKYFNSGYKMENIKEILIQDVSNDIEMERLFEYGIYKTRPAMGVPLYFAPHFTSKSIGKYVNKKGIHCIYNVIGVLTGSVLDIIYNKEALNKFSKLLAYKDEIPMDFDKQVEKWLKGIQLSSKGDAKEYTYYFLSNPLSIPKILQKDGGIEKGRGKNWIAASVSKNRCVSFKDFIVQLNKQ